LTEALAPAVDGERRLIPYAGQRIAVYLSERCIGTKHCAEVPLVLVHSVNAAASAAEVKPLFDHYALDRPVLALELPGFGSSDRLDRRYQPELMVGAVLSALVYLQRLGFGRAVDVIAVSLSSEFVALAAIEQPERFRSVALVSPTGLEGWRRESYVAGQTRKKPWLLAFLRSHAVSIPLFTVLTSRPSLRYFLRGVWGSRMVDPDLMEYAFASAHQPGARFAPQAFIAGALFTPGARDLYRRLTMPVWLAYGSRGRFADYRGADRLGPRSFWRREHFATGALPYFEMPRVFTARFDAFSKMVDTYST
jgi:pimeloyl-ACP methyl ester carboxylesterase